MTERLLNSLLLGLLLASLLTWTWIVNRWRAGEPLIPYHPRPHFIWPPIVLVATLLTWVVVPQVALFVVGLDREEFGLRNVLAMALSGLMISLVIPPILSRGTRRPLADLGIRFDNWTTQVYYGTAGFLASLIPVLGMLLLTRGLRDENAIHQLLRLLQEQPTLPVIFWTSVTAVIVAPLVEELVFRVILQGWLQSFTSPLWAILVVAVVFSAVHPWPDSLGLFPLAVILGYIYYRLYSYVAVVVLHALFNALNLFRALLSSTLAEQVEQASSLNLSMLGV